MFETVWNGSVVCVLLVLLVAANEYRREQTGEGVGVAECHRPVAVRAGAPVRKVCVGKKNCRWGKCGNEENRGGTASRVRFIRPFTARSSA